MVKQGGRGITRGGDNKNKYKNRVSTTKPKLGINIQLQVDRKDNNTHHHSKTKKNKGRKVNRYARSRRKPVGEQRRSGVDEENTGGKGWQ